MQQLPDSGLGGKRHRLSDNTLPPHKSHFDRDASCYGEEVPKEQ